MKPLLEHRNPTGAPLLKDTPVALLPALSDLRNAQNSLEAIFVLDRTPAHLHLGIVDVVTSRPQLFRKEVIGEALRIVGFARLRQAFGMARASNMIERFC